MEEKEEKKIFEDGDGTNKRDFLKALGLGVAGLSSMMGGQSLAEEKKGKYVIVITHGGNDPNRAIFGLLMAKPSLIKMGESACMDDTRRS